MRFTLTSVACAALATSLLTSVVIARAGQAGASFKVNIQLTTPQSAVQQAGVCISSVASQQTGAVVRVVCSSGQVVSIEAAPGTPAIAGVHGGAFRYSFGAGSLLAPGTAMAESEQSFVGLGTATALRIADMSRRRERLEFLVSF
jgi:hypothetical protein